MNKKKFIVIILVVIAILGVFIYMTANKENSKNTQDNINTENDVTSDEEEIDEKEENAKVEDNKIAVVYFSATGTTKVVAEYIKEATDGDIFEIVPKEQYTSSDLNYSNNNSRANKEQNDDSARPEIANKINIENYDTIYLGYPIWWGDVPKIILTFLDTYDLSGKTVIPFCTSGSSGISGSVSTLKNYNKNINWQDGRRFTTSSKEEINSWIKGEN